MIGYIWPRNRSNDHKLIDNLFVCFVVLFVCLFVCLFACLFVCFLCLLYYMFGGKALHQETALLTGGWGAVNEIGGEGPISFIV